MKTENVVLNDDGTSGATVAAAATREGAQLVGDLHGRYQRAVQGGNVFSASNAAAQAVSVALTTTYTGLCISNPPGSKKKFVMLAAQYAITVAPAAIASLHLIAGGSSAGVVTHTAALGAPGIQNALIGAASGVDQAGSKAKADTQATIVNPYYLAGLGSGFTAAALYATTPLLIDLGGLFIVGPGGWIAWGALTAVTGFGTFVWEEVAE